MAPKGVVQIEGVASESQRVTFNYNAGTPSVLLKSL